MINHLIIRVQIMTIKWVLEKYLRYSRYSDLYSSGLVEFYKSEKTAPEEFSLFHKIFTPEREFTPGIITRFVFPPTKQESSKTTVDNKGSI
jgi:hypothetical protein